MRTIRELRRERGWSQLHLASLVGVTPGTIYAWERGTVEPTVRHIRELARAFGLACSDEIALAEPRSPAPPRRRGGDGGAR